MTSYILERPQHDDICNLDVSDAKIGGIVKLDHSGIIIFLENSLIFQTRTQDLGKGGIRRRKSRVLSDKFLTIL